MDYEKLATKYIKEHEDDPYPTRAQMIAIRQFAAWLGTRHAARGAPSVGGVGVCPKCNDKLFCAMCGEPQRG